MRSSSDFRGDDGWQLDASPGRANVSGMPIGSNVLDPEFEGTLQRIDRRLRAPDIWNSLPQTMNIQTWLFNRGAAWIVWLRAVWVRATGKYGQQSSR
jgi:hypothetical protein